MTRDEVASMDTREINELIAVEVMGVPVAELSENWYCPYCNADMWRGESRSRCTNCSRWMYSPYKEYTYEIESAWEVVEKLRADGCLVEFEGNAFWIVTITPQDKPAQFHAAADAPLAICRAALMVAFNV